MRYKDIDVNKVEAPKPRNFVAKNAKNGGAGAHKDKKRAHKNGETKHKNKDLYEDKIDTVTLDVPLLIRLLEYAREDAKTDVDLHNVVEKMISISKEISILSMDSYDSIVSS